jgi:hypothetical protein
MRQTTEARPIDAHHALPGPRPGEKAPNIAPPYECFDFVRGRDGIRRATPASRQAGLSESLPAAASSSALERCFLRC